MRDPLPRAASKKSARGRLIHRTLYSICQVCNSVLARSCDASKLRDLVRGDRLAFRLGAPHQECERDHEQEQSPQQAKYRVVSKNAGLLLNHAKDGFARLMGGSRHPAAFGHTYCYWAVAEAAACVAGGSVSAAAAVAR